MMVCLIFLSTMEEGFHKGGKIFRCCFIMVFVLDSSLAAGSLAVRSFYCGAGKYIFLNHLGSISICFQS